MLSHDDKARKLSRDNIRLDCVQALFQNLSAGRSRCFDVKRLV